MNIETIKNRLGNLTSDSPAEFGIMTPQHMVEHLTLTVKLSYGRVKIPEFLPNEKQLAQKHALLFTDITFPRGVKAPGLPDQLLELRYPDLESAKSELLASLKAYETYLTENPKSETFHPRFGPLNFEEWERFHTKHFEHHLGQFGV
jgi:hypothetical protein